MLAKATPKICDQNRLAVTIEYVSSAWVGLKARKVLLPSPSSKSVFSTVAPWMAHNSAAPRTPATPIMWKGFSVQLWKPWKKRMNLKIPATPKLGAKNQPLCPSGYNRKTETKTAIGCGEGKSVVGSQPTGPCDLKLAKHEPSKPKDLHAER